MKLNKIKKALGAWIPSPYNHETRHGICLSYYSRCGKYRWSNHLAGSGFHSNTEFRLFQKSLSTGKWIETRRSMSIDLPDDIKANIEKYVEMKTKVDLLAPFANRVYAKAKQLQRGEFGDYDSHDKDIRRLIGIIGHSYRNGSLYKIGLYLEAHLNTIDKYIKKHEKYKEF